jgi:hypothetical protein
VTPAALAAWTPVAFNRDTPVPSIDWGDLRPLRFTEPFFDQTVARWAGGTPSPQLVRTDIEALSVLDASPSLEPDAIIFHLSRCGSTLVSRLLGLVPGTLVAAEPGPVNDLLLADIAEPAKAGLLRQMVRALGRRRLGDETHFILKTSSWNVRHWRLYRSAFPDVPVIWVQRDPAEVVASLLADPPSWLKPEGVGPLARLLFGFDAARAAGIGPETYAADVLATLLDAASHLTASGPALIVDYRDLPNAIWSEVAAFAGLAPDAGTISRLADEATYYSKAAAPRPFAGDAPERRALAATLQGIVGEGPQPLYRALRARQTTVA